jgi:hypothetical protein
MKHNNLKKKYLTTILALTVLAFLVTNVSASSTWRWSSQYVYYVKDYDTTIKFNNDLYCQQIGFFSDKIKFYNASMNGETDTFWLSTKNANVTVTTLFTGKRCVFSLTAPSTTNSTLYLGNLNEPTYVQVNGVEQNKGTAWSYTSTTLTINTTHSSTATITVDWNPRDVGPSFLRQTKLNGLATTYTFEPSQPTNITGWLTDIYANTIQDAPITILYNWLNQEQHAKTDKQGNFHLSFITPFTEGQYNITIKYAGNTQYTPCTQNITITIHKTPNPQTFISFYIIPAILLVIGAALFFKRIIKTKR